MIQSSDPNPSFLHHVNLPLILSPHMFIELLYARCCDTGFRLRTTSLNQGYMTEDMVRFFKMWIPGLYPRPTDSKSAGVFDKWSVKFIWWVYGNCRTMDVLFPFLSVVYGSSGSSTCPATVGMVNLLNFSHLHYYITMFLKSVFFFIVRSAII